MYAPNQRQPGSAWALTGRPETSAAACWLIFPRAQGYLKGDGSTNRQAYLNGWSFIAHLNQQDNARPIIP
jgi:hypothetical protein